MKLDQASIDLLVYIIRDADKRDQANVTIEREFARGMLGAVNNNFSALRPGARIQTAEGECILLPTNQAQVEGLSPAMNKRSKADCEDCERPYGHVHGFPDMIIPFDAWRQISTTKDDAGLLCPSCIVARLSMAGIKCAGAFASGPVTSVSYELMATMRGLENIELAIKGRDNNMAGVRDMIAAAGGGDE